MVMSIKNGPLETKHKNTSLRGEKAGEKLEDEMKNKYKLIVCDGGTQYCMVNCK